MDINTAREQTVISLLQDALVQPPDIDPVIDFLAEGRTLGKESPVLEFKASFKPSENDPDPLDRTQWNVVEALIAMANSYGGLLVLGMAEDNSTGELKPGGVQHIVKLLTETKHGRAPEEKDMRNKILGKDGLRLSGKGKTYSFPMKGESVDISIPEETRTGLLDRRRMEIVRCTSGKGVGPDKSKRYDVLAFLVEPLSVGAKLFSVSESSKGVAHDVVYYRPDQGGESLPQPVPDDYRFGRNPNRFKDILKRCRYAVKHPPLSTVPFVGRDSIVGRDKVAEKIHDLLFGDRKFPVLHGAPGMGKSTLAYWFAERFSGNFPGGLLFAPMRGADNWDEAFRKIVDQEPVRGASDVKPWLGLDKSVKEIQPEDVRKALFRRIEYAGPLLLVLDDVESVDALFSDTALAAAFPKGIPDGLHVIATARVCDCCEPERSRFLEVPSLNRSDSKKLLAGSVAIEGEAEDAAADELCRRLGDRPLWLKRISGMLKSDPDRAFRSGPYQDILAEFKMAPLHSVETVDGSDEKRNPIRLWQMAKAGLLRNKRGESAVLLARVRALFDPDRLPDAILEFVWKSAFPERSDDHDRAKNMLSRFHLVERTDDNRTATRMHRLDQETVKREERKEEAAFLDRIGNALSVFPPSRWAKEILRFCPQLFARAPVSRFKQDDWFWLFWHRPELAAEIDWSKTPVFRFFNLLFLSPSVAKYVNVPWGSFWGSMWAILLRSCPQFAPHCDWNKLKGADWAFLLARKPVPEFWRHCDWSGFKLDDWFYLLKRRPEFFPRCNCLDRLSNSQKAELLEKLPELADRIDWNELTIDEWVKILVSVPDRAPVEQCPWSELDTDNWAALLKKRPEFFVKCKHPERLLTSQKAGLLGVIPELAEWIDWETLAPADWLAVVAARPDCADRCPWDSIDCETLARFLADHPEHADRVSRERWTTEAWRLFFIFADSETIKYFVPWDSLSGETWVMILVMKPEYSDRCRWDSLTLDDWFRLLDDNPEYVNRPEFSKCRNRMALDEKRLSELVSNHPELAETFGLPPREKGPDFPEEVESGEPERVRHGPVIEIREGQIFEESSAFFLWYFGLNKDCPSFQDSLVKDWLDWLLDGYSQGTITPRESEKAWAILRILFKQ